MVAGQKSTKVTQIRNLDAKPHAEKIRKAGKLAYRSLSRYGEPSMSLDQLRVAVDKELKGKSLTGLILKEREAGS